jgi:ribosomal protein S30
MKAVKAAKMKLKTCEIIERGKKNQTGNQMQNETKYEKKIATSHLRGRDFSGILW